MGISRYEKRELNAKKMKMALDGHGLYVFENNTEGDMMLPKPTKSGQTKVGAKQQFQGDDYFMSLVRSNTCKLIRTLITPEQEKAMEQAKLNEAEQKLICDQPDVVTEQGQVEYVTGGDQQLNEGPVDPANPEAKVDTLINEDPVDGVDIIL